MGRDPRQGHLQALAHGLGGEDDVQLPGGHAGVLVEGLVEVAQAKQHYGVLVALFDPEVLAADGGQGILAAEVVRLGPFYSSAPRQGMGLWRGPPVRELSVGTG